MSPVSKYQKAFMRCEFAVSCPTSTGSRGKPVIIQIFRWRYSYTVKNDATWTVHGMKEIIGDG